MAIDVIRTLRLGLYHNTCIFLAAPLACNNGFNVMTSTYICIFLSISVGDCIEHSLFLSADFI